MFLEASVMSRNRAMRPEPVPTLKGKSAKEFVKQIEQPPSTKTIEIFREAERVFNEIRKIQ